MNTALAAREYCVSTRWPSFPLRLRLYYCYLLHSPHPAPWEAALKLLFAVTTALCFLLRWSHFVSESTTLFHSPLHGQVLPRCIPLLQPGVWIWSTGSLLVPPLYTSHEHNLISILVSHFLIILLQRNQVINNVFPAK